MSFDSYDVQIKKKSCAMSFCQEEQVCVMEGHEEYNKKILRQKATMLLQMKPERQVIQSGIKLLICLVYG